MADNTRRFSDRAGNYANSRPGYPEALIDYLYQTIGFCKTSVVADVGAGTGIFTAELLKRGSRVFAVEPNAEMAKAAAVSLKGYARLTMVRAAAEHTGLGEGSVDFITCAQSFHWFDREACQKEFRRILKPKGKVLLIWYRMDATGNDFTRDFETLHYAYSVNRVIDSRMIGESELADFFKNGTMETRHFRHSHPLDAQGLEARMLSSSHAPLPGDGTYARMMDELDGLFARYEQDGLVEFMYRTDLYYGEV